MFDIYEWIKKMKCEIEPAHEDLFRYTRVKPRRIISAISFVKLRSVVIKFMPDFSQRLAFFH